MKETFFPIFLLFYWPGGQGRKAFRTSQSTGFATLSGYFGRYALSPMKRMLTPE
jgi:hypothetical protein